MVTIGEGWRKRQCKPWLEEKTALKKLQCALCKAVISRELTGAGNSPAFAVGILLPASACSTP